MNLFIIKETFKWGYGYGSPPHRGILSMHKTGVDMIGDSVWCSVAARRYSIDLYWNYRDDNIDTIRLAVKRAL